jgi:hypothetical protein
MFQFQGTMNISAGNTGWFEIIVGVSVAHNFHIGNKLKLLMEYESVTQKVRLPIESILQNAK